MTDLCTSPVPDLRSIRWLTIVACLLPAAAVVLDVAGALRSPEGAPASALLFGLTALAWMGLFLRREWRELWIDLSRILLARVGLVACLLVSLSMIVVTSSEHGGPPLRGATASALCLSAAAAVCLGRRDARRLRRILVLIVFQVALLGVLDFAVRKLVLPRRSHDNLFATHDPVLGWKLQPGLSSPRKTELYDSVETINSLGFRTPEIEVRKPAGTRRIVILGDSQTESYTVSDDETYARLLEAELAEEFPVQVISLGVGGFSTDQELLSYLQYGAQYQPDLVLLQFSTNDVEYNALPRYRRGLKPYFKRYGEVLMLEGVPVPNLRNTGLLRPELLRVSAIALQIESSLRQLAIQRDVTRVVDPDEAWKLTELLIRDLAAIVRADGAAFCVFNATVDKRDPDARLRAILERLEVPYLDTLAAYGGDFAGHRYGGHWNQKGSRKIAEHLAPSLSTLLRAGE
jgi:lysophospholipase L1-like esterase